MRVRPEYASLVLGSKVGAGLWNVFPRLVMNNITYVYRRCTVLLAQLCQRVLACCMEVPNPGDYLRCEPCGVTLLPPHMRFWVKAHTVAFWVKARSIALACRVSGFSVHIKAVIRLRAEKQMGGINTSRSITLMADKQAIRNETVVQSPRKAVRAHDVAVNPELTVSTAALATYPKPARIGLLNIFPKAFLGWMERACISTEADPRTIVSMALSNFTGPGEKGLVAGKAGSDNGRVTALLGRAIMFLHGENSFRCAKGRAVTAAPPYFCAHYSTKEPQGEG